MDQYCQYCGALHFKSEMTRKMLCCSNGNIEVGEKKKFPKDIECLYTDPKHPFYENFHKNIRRYNSAFSFASLGACLISDQ